MSKSHIRNNNTSAVIAFCAMVAVALLFVVVKQGDSQLAAYGMVVAGITAVLAYLHYKHQNVISYDEQNIWINSYLKKDKLRISDIHSVSTEKENTAYRVFGILTLDFTLRNAEQKAYYVPNFDTRVLEQILNSRVK